ncbi:MAG: D-alanyl-D-alanine carboxypeptidase/D-alanyl-D-alanine-endopeptidase [Pyrinomonadaceae bacterium]
MTHRKERISRFVCLLLLCSLSFNAVSAGAQQTPEPQRERRVVTSSATARVAPASAPKTVEELRTRIREILSSPPLAPALVAVKAVSLDTGHTLFEENAGKLLVPASNMKMYTVAAALDRLTPDFRWKTSVYAPAPPDASGTIRGDLIVYGRGDPSLAASFYDGDYTKAIDELAERIAAAGVRRIEGALVGDEAYFKGPPYGASWEWDDLQWYYGAEVSALTVNDNAIDLFVKPGASVGAACIVTTGPSPLPHITISNHATTAPRGTRRDLTVYRGLAENLIEVSGSLPLDDKGYTGEVAIARPAQTFVDLLRASLLRRGINVTGQARILDPRARESASPDVSKLVEIASRPSPPLSVVAAKTLKPSQNLYTELILRTLGEGVGRVSPLAAVPLSAETQTTPPRTKQTSAEAGIDIVKAFLNSAGVDAGSVRMSDGSGLSRHDLVTANASVQLLTYISRRPYANAFRDALPIAGVDGTLANRMKNTAATGNIRAKTGTVEFVASLSGYATTAAGERLVFSIMVNNYTGGADVRRSYIDAIAELLASFSGRS